MLDALKMCLNRNVLIGLGVVALGVWVLAPDAFSAALPLLVLLACPLSMVVMMGAMGGKGGACKTGSDSSDAAGSDTAPDEIVRLRAEVDQMRAELRSQQDARPADEAAGPTA